MKRNNGGFSLVEIVVAMAILGAFSIAACTSLVLGLRLNDKSESMLQAQLAVSHAVETLMAEGITQDADVLVNNTYDVSDTEGDRFPTVQVKTQRVTKIVGEETVTLPFFQVTVASDLEDFSVTTYIREVTE